MPDLTTDLLPVDLQDLLVGLLMGALLSTILALQYVKYGRTLSNRSNLAYTIPLITVTIVLIISVVKSSIALSLGLVGALSIVRFRTPIKEPEELAYLFVAIAIGLGLGAGQTIPTLAATTIILVLATARYFLSARRSKRNLYLNVDVRQAGTNGDGIFQRISELLSPYVESADLRRLDMGEGFTQVTLYIQCRTDEDLVHAIENLKRELPDSTTVTFIDQDTTSGI